MTEVPPPSGPPNAYTCKCDCTGSGAQFSPNLTACYPASLNPALGGTAPPSKQELEQALATDCGGSNNRVELNLIQLSKACVVSSINCLCNFVASSEVFAAECDQPCVGETLKQDCSNFDPLGTPPVKSATNVVNQPPVCLTASSDPPNPVPDALAGGLYGRNSTCEVTGTVKFQSGDESRTAPASGVVQITGGPCPGGSCPIGISYRLDNVGTLDFDGFLGLFGGVRIEDVRALGASLPEAATLDTDGNATFPSRATLSSGRGTRIDEGIISDDVTRKSYLATNTGPIDLQALWDARSCTLNGALVGEFESGDSVTISANLAGTLVNQPPTAKTDGDKTVECTSPAGASVSLDASSSTDPDHNIVQYVWRRGARFGDEVGTDAAVTVSLAVDANQTYFLRVIDAFAQASEASALVKVVDTTPPLITSVAATPSVLHPANHKMVPVTVNVVASDVCSAPTCTIATVTSNEPINGPGDGNTAPDWQITEPLSVYLRAERSGTLRDRVYDISVTCSDPSGNTAVKTIAVTVPHN